MRIAIAGASGVGISIAHELVKSGHSVFILEPDEARLRPQLIPDARWVHMDVCEVHALEELRLEKFDVVVAATGDDKANLVLSLLAKTEFGVPRVVARVNDARNEWLFDGSWGVDEMVSTPQLLASVVEQVINVGELVRLMPLRRGDVDLLGIRLPNRTHLAGKKVGRFHFPRDGVLVAIVRDNNVIVPRTDDALEPGDELLFVANRSAQEELAALVCQNSPKAVNDTYEAATNAGTTPLDSSESNLLH